MKKFCKFFSRLVLGIRKTLVPTSMLSIMSQILAVKAKSVVKTDARAVIYLSPAPPVLRSLWMLIPVLCLAVPGRFWRW